jgi:hypothetical protein
MGFQGIRRETTGSNAQSTTGDGTRMRQLERIARLAILGIGFVVVADAVIRRLESIGPTTAVDGVRKYRGGSVPHDQTRIGVDDAEPPDEAAPANESDADDQPVDNEETNVDLTDGERSTEAIDERVESDVQDEPATPGEMSIDEDVADELRDDEK